LTENLYPDGKKFAFTVFDDTDGSTVENVKPVYDFLEEIGLTTTKFVWVFPPRGRDAGSCLQDAEYLVFIKHLASRGFEVGLHNVGDGCFSRKEIIEGFGVFRNLLGYYPAIHANHVSNPDNLYWWGRRFEWPTRVAYAVASRCLKRRVGVGGEEPSSPCFWGDISKKHLKYIRNLTFNDINTLKMDPRMPYEVDRKSECSNYWFSSSDGHTVDEFIELISSSNLDRLEREGGACIVYTHFSSCFVRADGSLHPEFESRMRDLASRQGWFVPVSTLLDYLERGHAGNVRVGFFYRFGIEIRWFIDRVFKKMRTNR
jgi:hypothetical protein